VSGLPGRRQVPRFGDRQPCPPVRHGAGLDTTVYSRVDAHPGRRDPKERSARGTGRNPARLLHSRHDPSGRYHPPPDTTSGAAHAIDQKSRRCANEENVHQTEMLEDPLIIVRGKELVAPDPTACDHHPAAWSEDAPADRNRTAGAAVAPSSSSACSRWTPWVLTAIPAQASRCTT
jgi:hypothetical protein